MPFILPVGWDTKERNDFAALLKRVWQERERTAAGGFLCWTAENLVDQHGKVGDKERVTFLKAFFDTNAEQHLPRVVWERQESDQVKPAKTDIRRAWLIAQIGMLEVKTDYDFGGYK